MRSTEPRIARCTMTGVPSPSSVMYDSLNLQADGVKKSATQVKHQDNNMQSLELPDAEPCKPGATVLAPWPGLAAYVPMLLTLDNSGDCQSIRHHVHLAMHHKAMVPHDYMMHVAHAAIARRQASGQHLRGSWKSSCTVAHWNFLRRASKTVMSIFGP